jgi:DNA/RNA-binding domain of Phe-tRNA-synthetase-like protein
VRLQIDREIFALFPGAQVAALRVRGADNRGGSAAVEQMLAEEQRRIRRELGAELGGEPRIACWRDAYRRFGANPKKHLSSVENLLRRVLAGGALAPINKLVDLYNLISLRYLVPVGGEDLAAVRGDIDLLRAAPGEPPVLLLGDQAAHAPHPGEIIYRDAVGAICRRWNWREAERTKLTEGTRDAVLVIETLPPVGPALLASAAHDLALLVEEHCGGQATVAVAGALHPVVELGDAPAG